MTKNLSQKFKVPSPPKVLTGKRVAKRMRGLADIDDAYFLTQGFHVPFEVPYRDVRIILYGKKKSTWKGTYAPTSFPFLEVTEQHLAKLKRDGYEAIFTSLPFGLHNEVVQVQVFAAKSERLRNPKPGIKKKARNNPRPGHVDADRLARKNGLHLFRGKRL